MPQFWSNYITGKEAAWTAIFTLVLTVFTGVLAWVGYTANKNTVVSQRAFISISGFGGNKILGHDGKTIVGVQFLTGWQNGGSTPTRKAVTHCSWQHWSPELPSSFEFPDIPDPINGPDRPFVVAPHGVTTVPMIIPMAEWQDVSAGKTRLYVWGGQLTTTLLAAHQERLSEFCAEITNVSIAPTEVTWQTVSCKIHNCYDEDCSDYAKRAKEH